jgi:hypothetical protein
MARIYDNIEIKFEDGLNDIISNVGVKRVDFVLVILIYADGQK